MDERFYQGKTNFLYNFLLLLSVPEDLDVPIASSTSSGDVIFQWSLPNQPNGVITNYSLYINNILHYTGLALEYRYV